jgi:hypothetical protein
MRATPAPMSLAAAGKKYLEVTRPYNVALERFEKAANGGSSVATLQARARAVAAANLAESRQLLAIAWPTKVANQIQALAKADAAARPHWLRVAAADSLSEMARHVKLASTESGKAPAVEIRRLLGLPKYDEKDYSRSGSTGECFPPESTRISPRSTGRSASWRDLRNLICTCWQ